MRRHVAIRLVVLLGATAGLFAAPLRQPPGPADFARVRELGAARAAKEIASLLVTTYQPGRAGVVGSTGNAAFSAWLRLYQWCSLISGSAGAGLPEDFVTAMTADDPFRRALFATLDPNDNAPAVLAGLETMWRAQPARWKEYSPLAIAIAVVRDQPPPDDWPHHQVRTSDVPRAKTTPREDYEFWIDANESWRIDGDLRRISPEELKFVVDAPVAASELRWAQKNARYPRSDFGRAFFAVSYRFDRVARQQYVWNEGPYTLEAIRERGGICVDQAYFAMLAGKARGLPTLFFTGQGADGGHAWFGYLRGEGRWELDCGRYANQGYAVGEAIDPQTWQPINDHELASLAESFRRTPGYAASQADLVMANVFQARGESSRERTALDSALATSPRNEAAWRAKESFLRRMVAGAPEWQAFHEAAIRQFANQEDIRVYHQRALAGLMRAGGDEASARALEAQMISQNRRDRADLSVAAATQRLSALVESGDFDDALSEYRSLLRRLGRTGGGNLFYDVVSPLADVLLQKGRADDAARVVELARGALRPEPGSILDQDLAKLVQSVAGKEAQR